LQTVAANIQPIDCSPIPLLHLSLGQPTNSTGEISYAHFLQSRRKRFGSQHTQQPIMPKDLEFSDSSSSVETHEERNRRKKKKHRRDDSDSEERRHRRRKSDKKRKKHKSSKRKKERKRHKSYEDSSHSSSGGDDESYDSRYRRRRHKRSRKDRKRRRKDDDEKKSRENTEPNVESEKPMLATTRGQILAKALHHLLLDKPDFASELPLLLIRLAGGTTFDLRQVHDPSISIGLQSVFEALEPFGVQKQEGSGMWMFQNPPGATRRDELVLLRIIASLLNDVGLTMDKVTAFEAKKECSKEEPPAPKPSATTSETEDIKEMKELTFKILEKFRSKDATLGTQLASLCMTIVEGESVSVDGIPDEELKTALESLFQACGLEKSEIEDDESDNDDEEDDDSDESPLMGYGLSSDSSDDVQMKLATIMAACREGPPKPKSIGPMRRPMTEEEQQAAKALYGSNTAKTESDDDEDDGPLLPGQARKARGPTLSLDAIKAQAEYRELELKSTAAGVAMPSQNGGREEWMINPGQHDFLSGIKSGQAIKSRGFQNKKSKDTKEAPPVHPAVQAEMDAIMQAHENARGPSLMDLHRSKKTQEKELAAASGEKEWKWSRDKDLDAGRRVDKDALGMILGGAADDLKSKFAGGFNR